MMLRGVFRRCPWCGGRGAFFVGWFNKADHCQSCGLHWRRADVGYELGAATITVIITFGALMLVLGAMVALTWPDAELLSMYVVLTMPLVTYGSAYLMWQSIDIIMRPPSPSDFENVVAAESEPSDLEQL